jgi:hypothetical protein
VRHAPNPDCVVCEGSGKLVQRSKHTLNAGHDPSGTPVEDEALHKLDYEWEVREMGLSPVGVMAADLWRSLEDLYRRKDLNKHGRQDVLRAILMNAWRHPALDPRTALGVRQLMMAHTLLIAGYPRAEAYRHALDLIAKFSPGDLPGTRRYVLDNLVKHKPTRRRMIELTLHLTTRQAAQVLPLSFRTIAYDRQEMMKMQNTEIDTLVARVSELERWRAADVEPRLDEHDRQLGVLPPERVEEEVERLLDQVLD